jgi:sporulation protein YlmC with PRC-barrel domain
MIKHESPLCGVEVRDVTGDRIGKVREVWMDERTGAPTWVYVDIGFLGAHHSFVPLRDAVVGPEHLVVCVSKAVVDEAPRVRPMGDTMADVEQDVLDAYYRPAPA